MKDFRRHPSILVLVHDITGHVLGFSPFKAVASVGQLSFDTGVVQCSRSPSSLVCFCSPSPQLHW